MRLISEEKFTEMEKQLTAAQERVKEMDRRNESNEAVLGMQHAVIADLKQKLAEAQQRLFNRNKEIDELIASEKTCGEISCDECNERFVMLKAKLAEAEKARDDLQYKWDSETCQHCNYMRSPASPCKCGQFVVVGTNDRLRAKNETLRAALKPFVEVIRYNSTDTYADHHTAANLTYAMTNSGLLVSHFRQARAALEKESNG